MLKNCKSRFDKSMMGVLNRLSLRLFTRSMAVRLSSTPPPAFDPIVPRILKYVDIVKREPPDDRTRAILTHGGSLSEMSSSWSELNTMYEMEKEGELKEMAYEDITTVVEEMKKLCDELTVLCQPFDQTDTIDTIQMEIEPGAGGQEAMLFAADLVNMYVRYATLRQWSWDYLEQNFSDHKGYVKCVLRVAGPAVYKTLKFEGGVHRVQRTPKTETRGRVHTSTASVAILPEPSEVQVDIKHSDCKWSRFRASGPGGMNVDHNDTAARVVHAPTGIAVESQQSRHYEINKEFAMKRLITIIYERQTAKIVNQVVNQRKLQVGSRDRSEKIRTYNMHQDRVTDHRLKQSFSQVANILQGGAEFDNIVQQCSIYSQREAFLELLNDNEC